jgi:hypothetical protein
MTTPRAIRDQVQNVVDYLVQSDLVLATNALAISGSRVTWARGGGSLPQVGSRHPGLDQYVAWVKSGAYLLALFDGSLVQVTYDVELGAVSGHRLAYMPSPFDLDSDLLAGGYPLGDVVSLYQASDARLRSMIRFDYDPQRAALGHPAVHATFNESSCRIACVAPLHILRFFDFVFRHFYPRLWRAHKRLFEAASWQHLEGLPMDDRDRGTLHFAWDMRQRAEASLGI